MQRIGTLAIALLALAAASAASPQLTGTVWRAIDPPDPGIVTDLAIDPSQVGTLYVSTNPDGAWATTRAGATDLDFLFTTLGLYEVHISRSPIAASNPLFRYSIDIFGNFRRTTNGGQSWFGAPRPSNLPWYRPWPALGVSPVQPQLILAGGDGAIARSVDGGSNWTLMPTAPPTVIVSDIEFVLNSNGMVAWAGTTECVEGEPGDDCSGGFTDGRGVAYSTDAGLTWTEARISALPDEPRNLVFNVATIPGLDSGVVAATEDGLWITLDWGATWRDCTPPGLSSRHVHDAFWATQPTEVLYAATADGVFRGDVAGGTITWSRTAFPTEEATSVETTTDMSNLLYVGYHRHGVWRTTDHGLTAEKLRGPHGGYPMATLAFRRDDETQLFVGTVCQQGIFRGDVVNESVATWEQMDHPSEDHYHYVMRIVRHPADSDTIYSTENNWFWTTHNGGDSWFNRIPGDRDGIDEDLDGFDNDRDYHLHGLGVSNSQPARIYVGNGHGNWGSHTDRLRLWRTDDGGDHWLNLSDNLPVLPPTVNETSLYDIAVSPIDPDVVYMATWGSENHPGMGDALGILRSTDGGITWAFVNGGLRTNLSMFVGKLAMFVRGGTLYTYAATLDGLYVMTGTLGTTWTDISPPGVRRFEAVAVDAVDTNTLYAGTSEAEGTTGPARIFRSTNGGATWTQMTMAMEPRAWSEQYRVRDIGIGLTRGYAVVEGSGIYLLDAAGFADR